MSSEISTTRIAIRLVLAIIIMSVAFFGSAGTLAWPEAWLYMVFQFTFSTAAVTTSALDPAAVFLSLVDNGMSCGDMERPRLGLNLRLLHFETSMPVADQVHSELHRKT